MIEFPLIGALRRALGYSRESMVASLRKLRPAQSPKCPVRHQRFKVPLRRPMINRNVNHIGIDTLPGCKISSMFLPVEASWDPIHRTEWEPRPPK